MIVTGGENVWPDVVEALLIALPSVREVAVVGRDDAEWGQRVVAVVVPSDPSAPPTLDDVAVGGQGPARIVGCAP